MNIVILGSGNIATHFGRVFQHLGHNIRQVYSRKKANADALASLLQATSICRAEDADTQADLYLLAVPDQAIASVAEQLPIPSKGIIVHCSGATNMDVLKRFHTYGVIYPLQSINKQVDTNFDQIPLAIEGNTPETTIQLLDLAKTVSAKAFLCNSKQRLALHTAAVFVNNFTNALYTIGEEMLHDQYLSFDLLKPIILETAQKIQSHAPATVQTGPAARGDKETIEKHLQFLREKPAWLRIYQELTEEITRKHTS